MGIIRIIVLVLLLIGALPTRRHSKPWGPYPNEHGIVRVKGRRVMDDDHCRLTPGYYSWQWE